MALCLHEVLVQLPALIGWDQIVIGSMDEEHRATQLLQSMAGIELLIKIRAQTVLNLSCKFFIRLVTLDCESIPALGAGTKSDL